METEITHSLSKRVLEMDDRPSGKLPEREAWAVIGGDLGRVGPWDRMDNAARAGDQDWRAGLPGRGRVRREPRGP